MVKHAHSQWFNVLSELGVIGLALFAVALFLFVAAAIGNPFARRRDPLHPLLVALQAGVIAFLVHISWDWDWDMAAIGTLVFVFVAVCVSYRATRAADERRAARALEGEEPVGAPAGTRAEMTSDGGAREVAPGGALAGKVPVGAPAATAGQPAGAQIVVGAAVPGSPDGVVEPSGEAASPAPADGSVEDSAGAEEPATPVRPAAPAEKPPGERPRRRSHRVGWPIRVAASSALLLLAVSWLPPYLALRAENSALAAASDGKANAALVNARRAATLDPLAVSPLLTEASLLQQLGRDREALARLQAAAKLQPQNYEVWYALGVLLHGSLGRDKAARAALTRALALNPLDAASRFELELVAQ